MHKINEEDERCVHKPELLARTGKSYTHLLKLMAQGLFPKPRDFNGRPAWLNSELVAWFHNMPLRPLRGDAGAEELYSKQHALAAASVASKRAAAGKVRRENVRQRKGDRP
jgi:predicted DNA-binding transcriptional regulator AlpA